MEGHFACYEGPICGRPFLVDALARVAPARTTSAWLAREQPSPRLDQLNDQQRAELAAHWTRLGQLEHASIAAFARFSLQLLALGATPQLVEDCTRALGEETAHTRLCFQLASAYAGRPVGPLDISGSLSITSLTDVVDLVIVEGCFGETGAVLDALDAAEAATDPVICRAYAGIAQDEERHAELAFRFLRWALERDPVGVRERLWAARHSPAATLHGAREVVVPCLDALLACGAAA